jgi:hypothetical protein
MGGTAASQTTEPDTNVHKGTLIPIVEGRLSDTVFHASANDGYWYLLGPKSQGAIGLALLNGRRGPTVTRYQAGPDYVEGGIILQCYLDAGAAAMEFRTAQFNQD